MTARSLRTACQRCGILRERKIILCRDCRSVLTKAELAVWLGTESDVELYHEKEAA